MKEDDIRKYASLMKELELTGLEIEMDGAKVRLERGMASSPLVQSYTVPAESVEKKEAAAAEDEGEAVASPMVGVFYTSPAENSDPFVTVGSKVRKGDTICIIEAMKLMNEIAAEFDGIVEKVSAKNGQVVGFGTELFRLFRCKSLYFILNILFCLGQLLFFYLCRFYSFLSVVHESQHWFKQKLIEYKKHYEKANNGPDDQGKLYFYHIFLLYPPLIALLSDFCKQHKRNKKSVNSHRFHKSE